MYQKTAAVILSSFLLSSPSVTPSLVSRILSIAKVLAGSKPFPSPSRRPRAVGQH